MLGYLLCLFVFALNGIIWIGHRQKLDKLEKMQAHLNRVFLATRSRR